MNFLLVLFVSEEDFCVRFDRLVAHLVKDLLGQVMSSTTKNDKDKGSSLRSINKRTVPQQFSISVFHYFYFISFQSSTHTMLMRITVK